MRRGTLAVAASAAAWTAAAALAVPVEAGAHARLIEPAPRDRNDGWTQGPCGATAYGDGPIANVTAGEEIVVRWEVTIPHEPTTYVLALYDDSGNEVDVIAKVPSDGSAEYRASWIVSGEPERGYTLQLVQRNDTYIDYYSCADLAVCCPEGGSEEGESEAESESEAEVEDGGRAESEAEAESGGEEAESEPGRGDGAGGCGCAAARAPAGTGAAGAAGAAVVLLAARARRRRARAAIPS